MTVDPELYPWLSVAAIAWGLADCFFGYAIFRVTVTFWGIVGGLILGELGAQSMGLGTGGIIAGMVVGGVVGGVGAFLLYLAAVFVAGFMFGATLGMLILANFNHEVALLSSAVIGIIGGILAVKLQRTLLILATALLGSFRALLGAMYFTQHLDWVYYVTQKPQQIPALIDGNRWLFPSVLVLAAVGAIAQFGIGSRASAANAKRKKE
ncbi:MAG TPA: DUF4203 domain-containing protein [Candidatus Didemnitutus sp.]|nr:DUF4203 domain-containing protein [Candidatus Didemnitutus sp.]